MRLVSSRNDSETISTAKAMIKGLSDDGGLFTPLLEGETIKLDSLQNLSYKELATKIIHFFIRDFSEEEIKECVDKAYDDKFDDPEITPLTKINDGHILELWHGPTSAFKDVALTLLPHLLTKAYQKDNCNKTLAILTATSGDTGKAALASFADVPNTAITVFFPEIGVSDIQKRQMDTSIGNNVEVIAVKGNFDDCQRLIKKATTDKDILKGLDNVTISSANSINAGRLIPQIVYYYYAYLKLVENKQINLYDKINFCVPTGNFGNILAGYLAKESGLPINKLICASNSNNILTDFINTGIYDLHRSFYPTMSPSMDILISSNLERLLYLLYKDSDKINDLMKKLDEDKHYKVDDSVLKKMQKDFKAYWTSEEETKETIKGLFENEKVLIDPHTAVALSAVKKYKNETDDHLQTVILSTANPYKFTADVLKAISNEQIEDPFVALRKLEEISRMEAPKNLKELEELPIRFNRSIEISDGMNVIRKRFEDINDDHQN